MCTKQIKPELQDTSEAFWSSCMRSARVLFQEGGCKRNVELSEEAYNSSGGRLMIDASGMLKLVFDSVF
jgi:hypothetical protein